MKEVLFIFFVLATLSASAQTVNDKTETEKSKLSLGGYAQVDFNGQIGTKSFAPAKLDVHKMVMLLGYKFNDKTQFVTEIEYEHVKEVFVEQAYLRHRINDYLNFKAG